MHQGTGQIIGIGPWVRSWIVVAYALAIVLAPGLHEHDERDAHGAPRAVAECCADGGVHLEHHPDAPDLSLDFASCLACQYRGDHQAALTDAGTSARVVVAFATADRAPETAFRPIRRASSRAPPHA